MPLSGEFDHNQESAYGHIRLLTPGPVVSATDIAPLIDELSFRHHSVELVVMSSEPPAAGWTEIAIALSVSAPISVPAVLYFKSFLAAWAEEDARVLRQKLYAFIRERRKGPGGRRYIPVQVVMGGVRFYFFGEMSDEEFQRRLRAASDLMQTLPDECFVGSPGPGEYHYSWDSDKGGWRGTAFGLGESPAVTDARNSVFDWMNDQETR